MNRRTFLKGTGLVLAAVAVPLPSARGALPQFWHVTYHRNPRVWSTHVMAHYTAARWAEPGKSKRLVFDQRRVTWVECTDHWLERNRIKAERILENRVRAEVVQWPAVQLPDGSYVWTKDLGG